jgi:hypothetical protein
MTSNQITQAEDTLEQTRRILTQTASPASSPAESACCPTAKQDTCCAPSEKSSCCGQEATAGGGCGCQQ